MKRERLSEASPAFRILSTEPGYGCRHSRSCPQGTGSSLVCLQHTCFPTQPHARTHVSTSVGAHLSSAQNSVAPTSLSKNQSSTCRFCPTSPVPPFQSLLPSPSLPSFCLTLSLIPCWPCHSNSQGMAPPQDLCVGCSLCLGSLRIPPRALPSPSPGFPGRSVLHCAPCVVTPSSSPSSDFPQTFISHATQCDLFISDLSHYLSVLIRVAGFVHTVDTQMFMKCMKES